VNADFIAAYWQIPLSAVLPIAAALAIFLIEAKGPLAPHIQASRGVVAPYFAAVSILFGLFAALLVSDVWQKASNAKHAVQAESDAVHVLAHLARANDIDAVVIPQLRAYIAAASEEDPYSAAITATRNETGKAYLDLLTTISRAYALDGPARAAMMTSARELLHAHDERLHLANDITAPIKWFAILIFGAITQAALLLVHVGNRRAMRVAVGLFTVAFSCCLVVVAIFDAPFEIILADEPGTSLRMALDGL
jgi:hypothetical protein